MKLTHTRAFATALLLVACASPLHATAVAIRPPVTAESIEWDHSYRSWNEILGAHVRSDRFDYKALKASRAKLDEYVKSLLAVGADEYKGWKREEQLAFWINAYNALTVQRVVDAYPIESIKDLGNLVTSVWDQKSIPIGKLRPEVGGEKLSLNEIQHKIVRATFKDARVHAALNCAAVGAPPLAKTAYTAANLDAQLERQARAWMADPTRNKLDEAAGKAQVSKVFDWYKEDFMRDAGGLQEWIAKYAPESERAWIAAAKPLKIDFLEYSWKLNDAK